MVLNTTVNQTDDIVSFRYLGISIGVIDIILGSLGNLLTIVAVLRNKVMCSQHFNMFIVNLGVIDLLTSLVMMPFNVTGYVKMEWPYAAEMCIVQSYFYFSCGYSSIVCLIAITINRLLAVVCPFRYRDMSPNAMATAIVMCWIIAPIFLFPFLVVSLHSTAVGGRAITGWKAEQLLCTFIYLNGGWKKYMLFIRFMFQLLPILIMTFSYCMILFYVRKSNTKRKERKPDGYYQYAQRMEATRLQRIENTEREEEDIEHSNDVVNYRRIPCLSSSQENNRVKRCRSNSHQLRREEEAHLLHVSVIVCATLTFLFLPSFVVNLIPGNETFDPRIHMAASNVTWLNSCVNPIIYVLLYKGMKEEYKVNLQALWSWMRKRFQKVNS